VSQPQRCARLSSEQIFHFDFTPPTERLGPPLEKRATRETPLFTSRALKEQSGRLPPPYRGFSSKACDLLRYVKALPFSPRLTICESFPLR